MPQKERRKILKQSDNKTEQNSPKSFVSFLSLFLSPPRMTTATSTTATSTTRSAKKLKPMKKLNNYKSQQQEKYRDQNQIQQQALLIPGLPNEITDLCLSLIKPSVLYSVCHSWRNFIYSPNFPPFLSLYAILLPSPPNHHHHYHKHFPSSSSIDFYSYDPISSKWRNLPQPPSSDPPLKLILKHPSFISRDFPIQTVSIAGNLVLLAATADNFVPALSLPLIFNPRLNKWSYGPPLSSPRRWCAAGACSGHIYVASGIGSNYSNEVAKSVEKLSFDNNDDDNTKVKKKIEWQWEMKSKLNDKRFSREAIEAVGLENKLYMVNVKGCYAKEGIVYDVVKDEWEDMKQGMKLGWRGPVASMDEEYMFCVNEVKGVLRVYDSERDCWDDLVEDERFIGAEQMSAAAGKVCVVLCGGGIVVVDVMAKPIRIWNVETPPGFSALAVHILPRMNQSL